MDRFVAMLLLFVVALALVLLLLAFFAAAPILCTIFLACLYTLYLFIAHESAGVHHAQEYENRFWILFSIVCSTALFFSYDSPLCIGLWSPSLGFLSVLTCAGATHFYDRHRHRMEISSDHGLTLRRTATANSSLTKLNHLGLIPVSELLEVVNENLSGIDQALIPSTINNIINVRRILQREGNIIGIFDEADPKALNYLVTHVKLGLIFYKIKDHRNFGGQNRTKMIELLAVHRLSALNVLSRVVVLHALQMMKFSANVKAEHWVRNIFLKTYQDELSDLKTLNDAKGNYFSMNKLIFEDLRSESIRQDILRHFQKQAATQQAHIKMGTKRSKLRFKKRGAWRKILSDVDDTLTCSGGSYPAGIDRRYAKKTLYPGVLAFYEELDLGTQGPDEWPSQIAGNLVFLSARPHVYKDMSEKQSFAKFQKLRQRGMHTMPSLLAGDMKSGGAFMLNQDMEPLAQKKFHNFSNYVQIYPEFTHVFIGDNGQGDVRAGELMHLHYRDKLEQLYVHVVQDINLTYGYSPERYRKNGLKPCFFRTYPDAAIHAATRSLSEGGPLIKMSGLRRVCLRSMSDFHHIPSKHWYSPIQKYLRREELNQGLWRANQVLIRHNQQQQQNDSKSNNGLIEPVELIPTEQIWNIGEKVCTPYGIGIVRSFTPIFDMYEVDIDWRSLADQVADSERNREQQQLSSSSSSLATENKRQIKIKIEIEEPEVEGTSAATSTTCSSNDSSDDNRDKKLAKVGEGNNIKGSGAKSTTKESASSSVRVLETVVETAEIDEDGYNNNNNNGSNGYSNGNGNNHRHQDVHIEVTLGANGSATATAIPPRPLSTSYNTSSLKPLPHHPHYSHNMMNRSDNNNYSSAWTSQQGMLRQDSESTLISDNVSPTAAAAAASNGNSASSAARMKGTSKALAGTSSSSVASSTLDGSSWSIGGDLDSSTNSYGYGQWDDNMSMSSYPSIGSLPSEYKKDYYQAYASSTSSLNSGSTMTTSQHTTENQQPLSAINPVGPDSLMHLPSFGDESNSGALTPRRNSIQLEEHEQQHDEEDTKNISSPRTSLKKPEIGFARARIQGRYITKYKPPKLPKSAIALEKKGSIFSFFGTASDGSSTTTIGGTTIKPSFTTGQSVRTPFGTAHVINERINDDGMIVVKMHGWEATAYLNKDSVTVNEKGFLNSFFRSLVVATEISPVKSSKKKQSQQHPDKRSSVPEEQPYPKGTIIPTPYGKGILVHPLPAPAVLSPTMGTIIKSSPSPASIDAAKTASAAVIATAPLLPDISSTKKGVSVSLSEKKKNGSDDATVIGNDLSDDLAKDEAKCGTDKDGLTPATETPPHENLIDVQPSQESTADETTSATTGTEIIRQSSSSAVISHPATSNESSEGAETTTTTTMTATTSTPPLVFADDVTKQFTVTTVQLKEERMRGDEKPCTETGTVKMTNDAANTTKDSSPGETNTPKEDTVTIKVALPEQGSTTEVYETVGISLDEWTLANGRHPIVYCTPEAAKEWKETHANQKGSGEGGYIFSTLTSLVRRIRSSSISTAVTSTTTTGDEQKSKQSKSEPPPVPAPQYEQYYKDGAAVDTSYGPGRVCAFRPSYGFYEIELIQWTLANGEHPKAYLTKDSISYRMAPDCQEGGSVLTNFGDMSGTLASVEPTTGVHVVTMPKFHMVCYLQPDAIVMPLKAAVGDNVATPYGEGRVIQFRQSDQMYQVQLIDQENTSATTMLYCQAECLTRIDDETNNGKGNSHHGAFGMDWFLRILTFNAFGGGTTTTAPAAATSTVAVRPHHSRTSSVASLQLSTSAVATASTGRRKGSIAE